MEKQNATRGYGLFEGFLAKKRVEIANKVIPSSYRKGRVLDIGCGAYPLFLINTKFHEKYGIEKKYNDELFKISMNHGITLAQCDIENVNKLDFDDAQFDVVTMLAVVEHLEEANLINILKEIYRILKPNGIYIMTTPSPWTAYILEIMSKLKLVSNIEIEEHKNYYSPHRFSLILQESGFLKSNIKSRYFEMFANVLVTCVKNKGKVNG